MLKLSDYEPEETTLGGHTMLLWRFDYQGHDIFVTIGQTMEEFKRDPYSKQDAQAALDRYIANVSRETKQEKSMGTKNNPGSYDCYANLDPDEPYFVLRAKDPMGAALVRNWADIRRQQIEMGNKPPRTWRRSTRRGSAPPPWSSGGPSTCATRSTRPSVLRSPRRCRLPRLHRHNRSR